MADIKFTFEDLKVYDKALDFIDKVYAISNDFLNDEKLEELSKMISGLQKYLKTKD